MVDRLKIAIDKARAARARLDTGEETPVQETGKIQPTEGWDALEQLELDPRHLEQHRIVTRERTDPAHAAFDVLRTRTLRALRKHGWTRVGVTSPDKGCGKTFVSTNLALSVSRQVDAHAVLMDLDLRAPGIAKVLGVRHSEPVSWFLHGDVPATKYLRRIGKNLAVGLNSERVRDAAELLVSPQAAAALSAMHKSLAPDVVIYDLPPMLTTDDVIGFLPQLDCVLLVAGGGRTRPEQVTECERLLADQTHLLGVVLNQGEGGGSNRYGYE